MALQDDVPTTLQAKLSHLVETNSASYVNANDELVIPAHALLSILRALSSEYGITLLKPEEEDNLAATLSGMPDYELSPAQMIPMFEALSGTSASAAAGDGPADDATPADAPVNPDADVGLESFEEESEEDASKTEEQNDARGTPRPHRNIFERQRTVPLEATPTRLKKRPQRLRGRSETNFGPYNGSENNGPTSPTASHASSSRRHSMHSHYHHQQMLSNPTSPLLSPVQSTLSSTSHGPSRPPSSNGDYFTSNQRPLSPDGALSASAMLYNQSFISNSDFSSAGNTTHTSFSSLVSPSSSDLYHHSSSSDNILSTSPHDSFHEDGGYNDNFHLDYDYENNNQHSQEDETVHSSHGSLSQHLLHTAPSMLSLAESSHSAATEERLETLQKANTLLAKKLRDSARELEHKLSDHEAEVDEMQQRIEDLKSELTAARREEKELKIKERTTTSQLATLEAEMSKLQRQLETSRASYQAMQKQYQEQCAVSEKYRDTIRKKDEELKHAEEASAGHTVESSKWKNERDIAEATIDALRVELTVAQQAQYSLDEQKSVNLVLKETIDRLRLDLDEIRNTSASPASMGKNGGSLMLKTSNSRKALATLDMELADSETMTETRTSTAVAASDSDELSLGEDGFEETIVTTRKRRLNRRSLPAKFGIARNFSDAAAQHLVSEYTSSMGIQTTPPRMVSMGSQTSPQPSPLRFLSASHSRSSSRDVFDATLVDDDDEPEDMRSSSSSMTLTSPSPARHFHKPIPKTGAVPVLLNGDMPPSYAHLEAQERQSVRRDFMQRWRPDTSPTPGVPSLPSTAPSSPSPPLTPLEGSDSTATPNVDNMSLDEISREAVKKWNSLKHELGFECQVIEQALLRRRPSTPALLAAAAADSPRKVASPKLLRTVLSEAEEQHVRTLTPRLAREWANQVKAAADAAEREQADAEGGESEAAVEVAPAPGSPAKKARSPRWQFYNMYNSAFYPTAERDDAPKRNWGVTLTGVGVWALVFMTAAVLPAAIKSESSNSLYTDRQLWSDYNAVGQVASFDGGLPRPGPSHDAIWTVAENIIMGAANVVRRTPT